MKIGFIRTLGFIIFEVIINSVTICKNNNECLNVWTIVLSIINKYSSYRIFKWNGEYIL